MNENRTARKHYVDFKNRLNKGHACPGSCTSFLFKTRSMGLLDIREAQTIGAAP